jgi:hypothetical protein
METEECDCSDVCGWTMPHLVDEGYCENCGTYLQEGKEEMLIEFECDTHGTITWTRSSNTDENGIYYSGGVR